MKEISYKEITELVDGGIAFTENRFLMFSECERVKQGTNCIALRDITGSPPYFIFFYPTQKEQLRIDFYQTNKTLFHKLKEQFRSIFDKKYEISFDRLYAHILANGYRSLDLS